MPRRRRLSTPLSIRSLLLTSAFSPANAQDACHIKVNGLSFDLSSIAGQHSVSRTRDTPPTSMEDILNFDICDELKLLDGVDQANQVRTALSICSTCVPHAH